VKELNIDPVGKITAEIRGKTCFNPLKEKREKFEE